MASTTSFEWRLTGNDVRPEAVPVSDFILLLEMTEQLINATAIHSNDALSEQAVQLRFTQVEEGSARYKFTVATIALTTLTLIGSAISKREYAEIPTRAIRALQGFEQFSKQTGWNMDLLVGPDRQPIAHIQMNGNLQLPTTDFISGETEIFGTLTRVGGTPPKLRITTVEGKSLSCFTTEDLARKAGERLYKQIGVQGDAEWDAITGELLTFKAKSLGAYAGGSIKTAFDALREAVHAIDGGWESIDDLDAAIIDLRGGDTR